MNEFEIRDLAILKNANVSIPTLKRQICNMVNNSEYCAMIVESLNLKTGNYRVVLQGQLKENEMILS